MTTERGEVLQVLAELSELYPSMRIGQLINLVASLARGPAVESIYDVEDDEFVTAARKNIAERRRNAPVAATT